MKIKNITIVGAGVIGMSWTLFYLSKGFHVTVNDTDPKASEKVEAFIRKNWNDSLATNITLEQAIAALSFKSNLVEALKNADFVHENGPERLEIKQNLFNQIDEVLPQNIIVASSSSGLPMSDIQQGIKKFPERYVIAHPFNPPHIMPLVEIVGGQKTKVEHLDTTQAFFDELGKKTVRLKKELPGHIANRIAIALYKEVLWLIQEDAISVADIDKAVNWGPGLRWGVMGPNLLYHLGGGQGGIEHFLKQFAKPLEDAFKILETPQLDQQLCDKLIKGLHDEVGDKTIDELEKIRDDVLVKLIKSKEAEGL